MTARGVQSLNLRWFLRLRWGAIAAQLLVFFGGDRLTGISVPLVPMLSIIAIEAATNLALSLWARKAEGAPDWTVALVMILDSVLLSALLYVTGGDSRTFAVLYLVNLALAAVLLRARWTWIVAAATALCLAVLVAVSSRAPARTSSADPLEWQLAESWVAYALAAALIVYFVQRTVRLHRSVEEAAEQLRRSAESKEKLASLATLAAGAAHELATPLSTIALVSKELEHQLGTGATASIQDARLIREEVERCRGILAQMAADAGTTPGEGLERLTVDKVIEQALELVPERGRIEVLISPAALGRSLEAPPRALAQALHGVLKNALQSCSEPVAVQVSALATGVRISVVDRGPGMPEAILARAGEPFFTTKEAGRGMGLGLFLSRSLVEQLGGALELTSEVGRGTRASLVLPFR